MKYLSSRYRVGNTDGRALDERSQKAEEQLKTLAKKPQAQPAAIQAAQKAAQSTNTQPTQSAGAVQKTADTSTSGGQAATQTAAQPSTAVQTAQQLLDQKLGSYQGLNNGANSLLDQILNREKFRYDVSSDPTYLALRERWMKDGNLAMKDTMANAAALTGGYGNSYAQLAGQQAYQGYMEGLSEMIPDLRAAALDEYDRETDALLTRHSLLQNERNYMFDLAMAAYNLGDDSLVRELGIDLEKANSYGGGGGYSDESASKYSNSDPNGYQYMYRDELAKAISSAWSAEEALQIAEDMVSAGVPEDTAYSLYRVYWDAYTNESAPGKNPGTTEWKW